MLKQNVRHPYLGIWMHFEWKEQIIYIKWCAEISTNIDVLWWCVLNAKKEIILLRNWSATTCIMFHVSLLFLLCAFGHSIAVHEVSKSVCMRAFNRWSSISKIDTRRNQEWRWMSNATYMRATNVWLNKIRIAIAMME